MEHQQKVKLAIKIGATTFVLFILVAVGLFVNSLRFSAELKIVVAPTFAKVEINGRKFSSEEIAKVEPGETTAKITADGFQSQEINLNIVEDGENNLYAYLLPEGDEGLSWYAKDDAEGMRLTAVSDALSDIERAEYLKRYPITAMLPLQVVEETSEKYTWRTYRIDSGKFEGCQSDFCVKITDETGGNHDAALQKIRDAGYNPDDYEIIYQYTPVQPLSEDKQKYAEAQMKKYEAIYGN